ncbi:MAG: class I SAM-dependent methyltransferase [Terriglobales bacterium]
MEVVQTCDACGAALGGRRVDGMTEVSLVQCDCGLVITSPRPTMAEIGAYYPATYYSYTLTAPNITRQIVDKVKEYKGGYPTEDGLLARALWRFGAAMLQGLFLFHLPYQGKNQRLLEIGCGSGLNLRWASEHGWDVYGLELGERAVAEAHRQGFANVRCANIEDAEFPAESFDAVLVNHTLEHLYSPTAAIRRSYEVLRPKGTLLVTVPKFDSWPRYVSGKFWANLDLPRHLHHFTQPVLLKLIQSAGFGIREVRLSSRSISLYFTLRTLKRVGQMKRIFTRPRGTLSDVMLVVAEKN